MFTAAQARPIVAYLQLVRERDGFASPEISQALANYWSERANQT